MDSILDNIKLMIERRQNITNFQDSNIFLNPIFNEYTINNPKIVNYKKKDVNTYIFNIDKVFYKNVYLILNLSNFISLLPSFNENAICILDSKHNDYSLVLKEVKKLEKNNMPKNFEIFIKSDFEDEIFNNIYFPLIFKIDLKSTIREEHVCVIDLQTEIFLKYYNFKKNDIIVILMPSFDFNFCCVLKKVI
jgi:hypothetical protein